MDKWTKVPPELVTRFDAALPQAADVQRPPKPATVRPPAPKTLGVAAKAKKVAGAKVTSRAPKQSLMPVTGS